MRPQRITSFDSRPVGLRTDQGECWTVVKTLHDLRFSMLNLFYESRMLKNSGGENAFMKGPIFFGHLIDDDEGCQSGVGKGSEKA